MTTMTVTSTRRTTWPVGLALGSVSAAALVVAGVWNVLIEQHLTVSSEPVVDAPMPRLDVMRAHYLWFATTVPQERLATVAGLVGVAGLALVAVEMRRLTRDVLGRGACTAIQVAAVVWMVGAIVTIGGHRAVALMATHGNPIESVNDVAFTTDVTGDAFSAAAFVLLAAGMLALAATAYAGPRLTLLSGLSGLTGLVAAVVAFGYVAGIDSITTYELGLLAAVLLPAWLIGTSRLLDLSTPDID
jgi:hypothetical protein